MENESQLNDSSTTQLKSNTSRYSQRPWRALLIVLGTQPIWLVIVGFILYGVFKLPQEFSNYEAFSTAILYTISGFLAYLIVPSCFAFQTVSARLGNI